MARSSSFQSVGIAAALWVLLPAAGLAQSQAGPVDQAISDFKEMVEAAVESQAPATAVQTTGTPGSPSATTTIPGNQLPPPAPPSAA
jgi:hypothetical protein